MEISENALVRHVFETQAIVLYRILGFIGDR